MKLKRTLLAVSSAAAVLAVQPAMADSLTFNGLYYSGADTVHIYNTACLINCYIAKGTDPNHVTVHVLIVV